MQVYYYDEETKEFLYEEKAEIDPLESKKTGKDVWLLPANSTFVEPLASKNGFLVIFNGNFWEYKEIEIEKSVEEERKPTNEDISKMRQREYMNKTDPLTLRKLRKQALGEWTEENEKEYISQIQAISKQIEVEFPYNNEEPVLGA